MITKKERELIERKIKDIEQEIKKLDKDFREERIKNRDKLLPNLENTKRIQKLIIENKIILKSLKERLKYEK